MLAKPHALPWSRVHLEREVPFLSPPEALVKPYPLVAAITPRWCLFKFAQWKSWGGRASSDPVPLFNGVSSQPSPPLSFYVHKQTHPADLVCLCGYTCTHLPHSVVTKHFLSFSHSVSSELWAIIMPGTNQGHFPPNHFRASHCHRSKTRPGLCAHFNV